MEKEFTKKELLKAGIASIRMSLEIVNEADCYIRLSYIKCLARGKANMMHALGLINFNKLIYLENLIEKKVYADNLLIKK